VRRVALGLATVLACGPALAASLQGAAIHLFDVTYGFTAVSVPNATYASPAGTDIVVVADDGSQSVVSIVKTRPAAVPAASLGITAYVAPGNSYTVPDVAITGGRYVSGEMVTGILAVPFKWHLGDRSISAGSTIGAYVGYRTSLFNLTVTPMLGAGLAMISNTSAAGAAQTSAGFSVATGFIGTVGPTGSGVQLGLILGVDWLGSSAHYRYEGKPWLAAEVGFSFGQ
jgi:hypothetical protein